MLKKGGQKKKPPFRMKKSSFMLSESAELERLLDLYWGGSERRITGLTIKIMGVNAIALIILMLGILYLGKSQNLLIETKLKTLETEIGLIATTISMGALGDESKNTTPLFSQNQKQDIENILREIGFGLQNNIKVVDRDGLSFLETNYSLDPEKNIQSMQTILGQKFNPLHIIKELAIYYLSFLPDRQVLALYPASYNKNLFHLPEIRSALAGKISISAWTDQYNNIILTAAAPLEVNGQIKGAVLLSRIAFDIEAEINEIWLNIIRIFLGTILLTVLISIYFSGTIARPLKRLASAAESYRKKQSQAHEIPDLSHRHDEIGELSLVLRNMVETLSERMTATERFAADVAHELKNPLTSLKSAVETALIVKNKEDLKKLLGIIRHDIERLDRLITDISSTSKLDAELSRSVFSTVDIKILLQNIIESHRDPLVRGRTGLQTKVMASGKVDIELKAQENEKFYTHGMGHRLAQVFQNLLDNALSFSPPNSKITISLTRRLGAIIVVLEDEGPGIPETKLETIFERFYSERPETESFGNHSGLGLSICRQIILAQQGRIFAENRKDPSGATMGARFTVILNQSENQV